MRLLAAVAVGSALTTMLAARPAGPRVPADVLRPTAALPAALVQDIESPRAYVEASTGEALVLDGASQSVFAINARKRTSRRVIPIGTEPGHILRPTSVDFANDVLAIADSPGDYGRVQYFGEDGRLIGSFYLRNEPGVRIALGGLSLQGPGTMAFTGRTFIFNAPAAGWLMSEFDNSGAATRGMGALRPTGHEADPVLHAALNAGIPVVDPTGGFFFVFQTATPLFRKYDRNGTLLFERHIEGPELDAAIASLPTKWESRKAPDERSPVVPALVRAARADRHGRLWVSLSVGSTYIFDANGDKVRTVRFQGSAAIEPISLFFTQDDRLLVTPGCYEFRVSPY